MWGFEVIILWVVLVLIISHGYPHPRRKVRLSPIRYDLLVTAIKANQHCKPERQNFSLLRSTPLGKHIEPEIAKEAAISLIDCFHRMYLLLDAASWTLSKRRGEKPQSSAWRREVTASKRSINTFRTNDQSNLRDKHPSIEIGKLISDFVFAEVGWALGSVGLIISNLASSVDEIGVQIACKVGCVLFEDAFLFLLDDSDAPKFDEAFLFDLSLFLLFLLPILFEFDLPEPLNFSPMLHFFHPLLLPGQLF